MGRSDIYKDAKPFKKGDSRINRKGRPKLPDIREALANVLDDEKDGMKALDAILKALRNRAIKGDVRAAAEILDRAYGKSQSIVPDYDEAYELFTEWLNTVKNVRTEPEADSGD